MPSKNYGSRKRSSAQMDGPANNFIGMQELRIMKGIVMNVNTTTFTCGVRTQNGVFDNVCIPIVNYSPGTQDKDSGAVLTESTGFYHMPSEGDNCIIGLDNLKQAYIINFYTHLPTTDLDVKFRQNVPPHTYKIQSRSGDQIDVSFSEEESKDDEGNIVITRTETPKIRIKSQKNIELNVENDTKSYIISIEGLDSDEISASMSVNKLTRKDGIIDKVEPLSEIKQDSATGNVTIETTEDAPTGEILLKTPDRATPSPIITADTLIKILSDPTVVSAWSTLAATVPATGLAAMVTLLNTEIVNQKAKA